MKYSRRKIYPLLLTCLLAVLLCSTAGLSLAATYTASPTITSEGNSPDWGAQFTMSVSISGTQSTYRIGKTNGETFTSSGTMHLKAGTFEAYGTDHDSKPVTADVTKVITFTEDFDEYPIYTYPKLIYARYVSDGGYWSWVGPIKITPELPPSNEIDYKADRYTTITGDSYEETRLRLQVSIDGADALFMVTKNVSGTEKPTFQSAGTMAVKLDSSASSATNAAQQDVVENYGASMRFNVNLDDYPASSYPRKFYARYKTDDGGWAWAGPITVSRITTEEPGGSITSPSTPAQGNLTVKCDAHDPAGIEKVSIVFVPNGDPLVMCENGTSNPCNTTSDTWSKSNVDPLDYGVAADASEFTLGLWIRNGDGKDLPLDSRTIDWSQEPPSSTGSTGSITSPGSSAEGNFTVSCNADDPAGLKKVSVVFVPNGTPLVLCDDSTSNPCDGTDDSWSVNDVNPMDYGVTGEGSFTLGLWVRNENGDPDSLVDSKTVNWSKAPPPANTPPSGSFTAPSGLVNGLVTIRATASDADGLKKVSAVFVPNGTPLVLCDDATSHTCSGTDGSWELAGVNPDDYGVEPGNISFDLHVEDETDGNTETFVASTDFTWIPPHNQFPKDSKYFNVCVGHNYEQQAPLEGVDIPSVSFTDTPSSIKSGKSTVLHVNGSVDTANGGSAFYYYCTQQGSLLYDDAKPDQVTWIAPFFPGYHEPVKLYVQIGDGLGYINSEVKIVNVSGSITKILSFASGLIYPDEVLRQTIELGEENVGKLISFLVKWPGSDIDLLFTKPDGSSLDYTGDTVVGYYEGKTKEYYVVYNDQQGTWEIDLKAVDVAEEGEPYEFIVYVDEGSASGADTDQDGIPDSWERDHFGDLTHDATTDADNDGLNDFDEFQRGTDPNNSDSDYDGMPDGWEVQHGLDPLINDSGGDADGDGFSNLEEYNAGTDPQDASSMPIECSTTVPDNFTSIQDAANYVAITEFGGNVCVQPGTYTESKLKLQDGVYLVALSDDPAATIIDGNGKDDVITFQGVRVGGVIGFTLRNSKKNGNAAAINISGAKQMPLIARNIITDNKHGIRLQGNVMPLVINNTIADNKGDGIAAGGNSPATVINNIVVSNKGDGIISKGKAIDKLARNDVYNNKGGDYVRIAAGEGGISLDPRFSEGYRLASDSPCIGTGLTLDGETVDMGAYGNSSVRLINETATAMFTDTDEDGIDDHWEQLFFGNLTTANANSDYDQDGYSDMQEYQNNLHRHVDPEGISFDLTGANEPGGTGYREVTEESDMSFPTVIINFLLSREESTQP